MYESVLLQPDSFKLDLSYCCNWIYHGNFVIFVGVVTVKF